MIGSAGGRPLSLLEDAEPFLVVAAAPVARHRQVVARHRALVEQVPAQRTDDPGLAVHEGVHPARGERQRGECLRELLGAGGIAVAPAQVQPAGRGQDLLVRGPVDLDERERLVADLGTKNAMILRNHGTLAVGKNVGECFIRLYYLERACQAQVMALTAGEAINRPPQGSPEVTAQQGAVGLPLAGKLLAWPALKRKAYRLDPSFAS